MRITKGKLKQIIREEYSRLKKQGLIYEMGFRDMRGSAGRQISLQDREEANHEECVQRCLAAIPPNMKKICSIGMGHMVINDVWHICSPICEEMGCDCDLVSDEVHDILCSGR